MNKERTSQKGERLTDYELGIMRNKRKDEDIASCPDCEAELYDGPGGGSVGNMICKNCESRFNDLFVFGIERINDKQ